VKSVPAFIVRSLPLHSAIITLIAFLFSYEKLLIPISALSVSGSCRHWPSAFCYSLFLCIHHILFAPTSFSLYLCSSPQVRNSRAYSKRQSNSLCGPSCCFTSPPLPCLSSGFCNLCAPNVECNLVTFAVGALLLYGSRESPALWCAPHCCTCEC
jgi:hypothetical protein